jgi:hypothetical protein
VNILRNAKAKPFVTTLYHELYCANGGPCNCKSELYNHATEKGLVRGKRKLPDSLTILGGEEVKDPHPALLKLPQVADALKRGDLISRSA